MIKFTSVVNKHVAVLSSGLKGTFFEHSPISKISKLHRLIPRFLAGCRSPLQAKGEPLKVREFNVVRVRVCLVRLGLG